MIKWINCVWQSVAIAALFAGCNEKTSTKVVEQSNADEIAVILESWIGRHMLLPTNIGFFTTNGDSINRIFPTEEFKIVRYIGKDDCTSCRLHLIRYPKLLSELSEMTDCQVGLVNIINPANMDDVRRLLWRDNQAGLTLWIDEADSLNRLNGFPEIGALQTFLVDGENRVLASGDPAVNPRVMQLFVDVLRSDSIRARGRHHLREQVVAQ